MLRAIFALVAALPAGPRRWLSRTLLNAVWDRFAIEETVGREHLPPGPCLFICNHLSNADGVTLQRALRPRRIFFLAGVKLQSTAMTRVGTEAVDTVFIRPNSPDIEALRRAVEVLKSGESLLIFPEGGRSRTGGLVRAKKGVALIAKRAGVPVVPVGLTGTEKLLPINDEDMGGERIQRARLTVRFGAPFRVEDLAAEAAGADDERQALTDAMMRRVARLLPAAYRGVYADEAAPGEGRAAGELRGAGAGSPGA